jgi:hypothetical protein
LSLVVAVVRVDMALRTVVVAVVQVDTELQLSAVYQQALRTPSLLALAVVAALAEILALLVETQYLDQSLLSVVVVVVRITSDQLREVPVVVQELQPIS